jgi:hypothetical protein
MPTASSRPVVTWAWLTSNWLTWLASSEALWFWLADAG